MTTVAADHHLALQRDLDAPRADVWAAFTEPEGLSAWFGPRGFHVPVRSVAIDAVPGGVHRLTMVSSADRQMRSDVDAHYVEVEPQERFVVSEDLEDGHAPMILTVRLSDVRGGAGCRVDLEQGPYPEHMVGPAAKGWESSLDKLAAHLAGEPVDPEEF